MKLTSAIEDIRKLCNKRFFGKWLALWTKIQGQNVLKTHLNEIQSLCGFAPKEGSAISVFLFLYPVIGDVTNEHADF